jgi:hypothetical protein
VITPTSSCACEELRMWRLQSWKVLHLSVIVNGAHLSLAGIVPDVLSEWSGFVSCPYSPLKNSLEQDRNN